MRVTIVIATYNRRDILERSLEYLFRQDYPKDQYEIIVVDDGSSDGTQKVVEEKNPSCGLKYLKHKERCGQSKAKNLGISHAQGEVIIFIDDDVFCPPQFIRQHARFHKKYDNVIVDGPAINTDRTDNLFGDKKKRFLAFLDFFGASFITSNTSCRKGSLIKAGGFDEEFGKKFGWQDRELGFRLRKMGLKRKKNRRAYVFHFKQKGSLDDFAELFKKEKERGMNAVIFYRKHPVKKIGHQVRFRYLWYDGLIPFKKLIDRNIEVIHQTHWQRFLRPFLTRFYLIHAYTEGLKEGLKKEKLRI
jgi:glycosyltransferase involved in cell wall biosynthesis